MSDTSQHNTAASPLSGKLGWILLALLVFGSLLVANQMRPAVIDRAELASLGYTPLQDKPVLQDLPALADHRGQLLHANRLVGQWTLVFFGFTSCPDICPTTMAILSRLVQLMPDKAPQVVFISVDPERDAGQRLGPYVEGFNPSFTGITGSQENVSRMAHLLQVVYERSDNSEYYLVDHSTHIAVIDPNGRFTGLFKAPHQEDKMARALRLLM